jgi:hypothetical protein
MYPMSGSRLATAHLGDTTIRTVRDRGAGRHGALTGVGILAEELCPTWLSNQCKK